MWTKYTNDIHDIHSALGVLILLIEIELNVTFYFILDSEWYEKCIGFVM